MRRHKFIACVAVTFALIGVTSAQADQPVRRWHAQVRCRGLAEDSMAHVRLVAFEHHSDGTYRLVYKCKSHGY